MQKQRIESVVIKCLVLAVVFAFAFVSYSKAQMFDFEDNTEQNSSDSALQLSEDKPTQVTKSQQVVDNVATRAVVPTRGKSFNTKVNNQNNKVTINKVETVNPVDPNEKIYMYMRNFKVSRTINGRINCDMRFYLVSKVKEKITNISYRLKWPNMETALSFSNVDSEGKMYKDYTLLGEGCYEMDNAPNIIVNRCRIKGRSQEHCASIIKWAK